MCEWNGGEDAEEELRGLDVEKGMVGAMELVLTSLRSMT